MAETPPAFVITTRFAVVIHSSSMIRFPRKPCRRLPGLAGVRGFGQPLTLDGHPAYQRRLLRQCLRVGPLRFLPPPILGHDVHAGVEGSGQ